MAASQPNHVHSSFYRYRKVVFRRRRLKRPILIAKSVYGYIRTKVTACRHFHTDLSVQKSERVKPTLLVPAWSMAPGASRYSHRMCAPRQETTADVRVYI